MTSPEVLHLPSPSAATRNGNHVQHSHSLFVLPSHSLIHSLCLSYSFILSFLFFYLHLIYSFNPSFCLIHSFSLIPFLPVWPEITGFHSKYALLHLGLYTVFHLKHWTDIKKSIFESDSSNLRMWRHQGFAHFSGIQVYSSDPSHFASDFSQLLTRWISFVMRINEKCYR